MASWWPGDKYFFWASVIYRNKDSFLSTVRSVHDHSKWLRCLRSEVDKLHQPKMKGRASGELGDYGFLIGVQSFYWHCLWHSSLRVLLTELLRQLSWNGQITHAYITCHCNRNYSFLRKSMHSHGWLSHIHANLTEHCIVHIKSFGRIAKVILCMVILIAGAQETTADNDRIYYTCI